MKSYNQDVINQYKAPVRNIYTSVSHYGGDGIRKEDYKSEDDVKGYTYERIGNESKFYGYGICQKINIHILDTNREKEFLTSDYLKIYSGAKTTGVAQISPNLYITETHRDEITNELSITAYDAIYQAAAHTVSELDISPPMTIAMYAGEAAAALGLTVSTSGETTAFATTYADGANLEGTETLRELLDAIAEATQTIYYIDIDNKLVFQRLDRNGAAVYTIDKEQYFNLDSGDNRRLAAICHTTELGDSITAALEVSGTTQYIRDNPFYELRTDTHTLLDKALERIGGLTINQLELEWRGNPLIEICDKIAVINKDGSTAYTYLLNDVITYDGTMRQNTRWRYTDDTAETENNPTTLGEALYKTYAKVDKVNKEINIVASESEANRNSIAALQMNTESIVASVSRIEENTSITIDGVNKEITTLSNKVDAAMTAEGVKLSIQEELANGVDKVYTATGFSFDAEGLRVSKTGSEMESLLDEDGLTVYRDDVEVLTADNSGVNGLNMTIRQYLIVGGSRFETYGGGRTGCFWIG